MNPEHAWPRLAKPPIALVIDGLPVVCVKAPEPKRRSWWVRWFTRPWMPFKKWVTFECPIGPDEVYRSGTAIYAGERAYAELKKAVEDRDGAA